MMGLRLFTAEEWITTRIEMGEEMMIAADTVHFVSGG